MARALLDFVINPDLRRGIRVQGTLTLREVQYLEEVDAPKKGNGGDVQCPERNMASVAVFTVESAY